MEELKSTELLFPKVETWFICWEDTRTKIKSYGSITPKQCFKTPWIKVDFYNEEQEWIDALAEQDINPYPVEEEEEDDYLITE